MLTTTVRRAALAAALLLALPLSLSAQTGMKGSVPADNSSPSPSSAFLPNAIIAQGFDTVVASGANQAEVTCVAGAQPWLCNNNSTVAGTTGWFQGNPAVFTAQAGAATNSYIGANFNNTAGTNTISNWLISPQVTFNPGATISFWTRAGGNFPDRLQVRVSTAGASSNVGTLSTDVGDFTTLVFDVNPGLLADFDANCPNTPADGYPVGAWCQITIGAAQGVPTTGTGRVAFRYFTPLGGPSGANSSYIGIDTVSIDEGTPPPMNTDLALTQSNNAGGNALFIGSTFQKTLTVTNNGPGAATAITVTDTLPAQLTFVSSNCGATAVGQVVTYTIPALAVSASNSCIITVRVAATGTIVNTAAITAQTPADSTPGNNTTTAQIGATGGGIAQTAVPALDLKSVLVLLGLVSALGMLALRQRQA